MRKEANDRKGNPSNILLNLLTLLLVGVLIWSAAHLYPILKEYREGDAAYDSLDAYVEAAPEEPEADTADEAPPEDVPETEEAQAPADSKLLGRVIDHTGLASVNGDYIGWLSLPGTVIDYPVVQGTDNSYYLKHLFNRRSNSLGAIFEDSNIERGINNKNTILYGHHMRNGSMFAKLEKYKKQSYYNQHRVFYFYTPEHVYRLYPFAGRVTNAKQTNVPLSFDSDEEFLSYIEKARGESTFSSDVAVQAEDSIVTMVTCVYDFSNARYALLCKVEPVW